MLAGKSPSPVRPICSAMTQLARSIGAVGLPRIDMGDDGLALFLRDRDRRRARRSALPNCSLRAVALAHVGARAGRTGRSARRAVWPITRCRPGRTAAESDDRARTGGGVRRGARSVAHPPAPVRARGSTIIARFMSASFVKQMRRHRRAEDRREQVERSEPRTAPCHDKPHQRSADRRGRRAPAPYRRLRHVAGRDHLAQIAAEQQRIDQRRTGSACRCPVTSSSR